MTLRFLCITDTTGNGHCPALWIDEETGEPVIVGKRETDPGNLAKIAAETGIGDDEWVIRLPADMKDKVVRKLLEEAPGEVPSGPHLR